MARESVTVDRKKMTSYGGGRSERFRSTHDQKRTDLFAVRTIQVYRCAMRVIIVDFGTKTTPDRRRFLVRTKDEGEPEASKLIAL